MNFPGYSFNGAAEAEKKLLFDAYQNLELIQLKKQSVSQSIPFIIGTP